MNAGEALSKALKDHGVSQNKIAVRIGSARSTVNQWVNGVAEPLSGNIPEIADGLDEIEPGAGRKFLEDFLGRAIAQ